MASRNVISINSNEFQLDNTITAPGGSVTNDTGATTDSAACMETMRSARFRQWC